jgi:shikimate kinase
LPRRIILTGFMGAGKSTVGMRLADMLGWTFADLDEEIVRTEGKSIADIFETAGESAFRALEHRALRNALLREEFVLALGGGAVETAENLSLLQTDPQTWLVYLEAPLELLLTRCDRQHGLDEDVPRRPVLENRPELTSRFLRRKPLYESAHWTVATADRDPEQVARAIFERWKARGAVTASQGGQ